jgi:hypothetical protein
MRKCLGIVARGQVLLIAVLVATALSAVTTGGLPMSAANYAPRAALSGKSWLLPRDSRLRRSRTRVMNLAQTPASNRSRCVGLLALPNRQFLQV